MRSLRGTAGAVVFAGVTILWSPYHSTIYPYTISQPSSFRHAVIAIGTGEKVDLFAPPLGSASTHVIVSAVPGMKMQGAVSYLQSIDGRHIRRSGTLTIMGKQRALMCADFNAIGGNWRIEQVSFIARGYVWRLTASYASQFRSLRPMMLRMLRSFKFASTTR